MNRATGSARIHPAFAASCNDRGVEVSACRPYRARTKGNTESGVGYVKRNTIAGPAFTSFAALVGRAMDPIGAADRFHGPRSRASVRSLRA